MNCKIRSIVSVCKEKLWGQVGEELENIRSVPMLFYCAFLSYYNSNIIEVLMLNKQSKMHSVAVVEYGL
jgi:hypothetical protein